jgi:four helix bundle protein
MYWRENMTAKNYRDLIVWQRAFQFALEIYKATSHFPSEEKYGLIAQLRKAGVSVPSNIAEGEGRNSRAEFRRFLLIAHGSLREVETQILMADALKYLKRDDTANLTSMASEVGRLINGMCRSLRENRHFTADGRLRTAD